MNNIGWGIFENAIANVTLSVAENSYAQTYAERYGIAYVTRTAKFKQSLPPASVVKALHGF